ncbi:MAG: fused MFS/spermidine synthase [Deltaproteobacteria bacterium]|nr:fused MFS/spermidine synthase [Deltaproteobacteria bacterium]
MRELGFLFGNDAHAVATTLAAFFLGIAAGSAAFGRWAERTARPLLAYAALEGGVAIAALLYFGLLDAFAAAYEPLFATLGESPYAMTAAKFGIALLALFPAAFFMGGTLPLMSQHMVRRQSALGATAALLYAVNTAGAAAGAFAAPFLLVPRLGVRASYATALGATLAVALLAVALARNETARPPSAAGTQPPDAGTRAPRGLALLALLSGFTTIALEVLWTRMFAQVLQNSVYTFAVILVTFLLALAAGAALARALSRRELDARRALGVLLVGGGLLVATTPFVFATYTDGLDSLGSSEGFGGYVLRVFLAAGVVLGLPTLWLGVLFPYLVKTAEAWRSSPGRTVGRLASANTLGGVAGSLTAGFVMLEALGLWLSIAALALAYVAAGLWFAAQGGGARRAAPLALAAALLAAGTLVATQRLPRAAASTGGEQIVEVFEGPAATVAVVRGRRGMRLKHNNHYGLGGSDDRNQEARQAHWPLLLHPSPANVFFLGMGTGITAGAALQHPIEQLLVTELSPEVVEGSRRHFTPWTNGLFEDPRATIRVEDGRNVLRGSRQRYDVIVADLFLPWRAGVGSLYSREHYAAALERLAPGGSYAQWLLLIQFSEEEFKAVARTLVEVFPRVTLWRANARATHPLVLLLGERDPAPLDIAALERRIAELTPTPLDARGRAEDRAIPDLAMRVLYGYQGNLTAARALLADAPVNTDDRPYVEYSAPITHRRKRSGDAAAFRGDALLEFYDAVFSAAPPESDPLLAGVRAGWRRIPRAGLDLFRSRVLQQAGEDEAALAAFARNERELAAALADSGTAPEAK